MTHMPTLIFLDNDSIAFQYKMEPDITNGRKQPFVADLKARQRINSSRNCWIAIHKLKNKARNSVSTHSDFRMVMRFRSQRNYPSRLLSNDEAVQLDQLIGTHYKVRFNFLKYIWSEYNMMFFKYLEYCYHSGSNVLPWTSWVYPVDEKRLWSSVSNHKHDGHPESLAENLLSGAPRSDLGAQASWRPYLSRTYTLFPHNHD